MDFYNSISYRPNRFLRNRLLLLFLCMLCICIALTGCSSPDSHDSDSGADSSVQTAQANGTRDATAQVLVPQADGIVTYGSDIVSVDASHTSDGYVMLRYTGSNEKVKLQVILPDGTEYTYPVTRIPSIRCPVGAVLTRSRCWNLCLWRTTSTRFLLPRIWM